jgi:ATP-dependent RNA helicase DDX5/DBP2
MRVTIAPSICPTRSHPDCTLLASPYPSQVRQHVHVVEQFDKMRKLTDLVRKYERDGKMLIFTATKREADSLCRMLSQDRYSALAIHGDKSQQDRDWVLAEFKGGKCQILVATDVASRGLDVKDVKIVINWNCACDSFVWLNCSCFR